MQKEDHMKAEAEIRSDVGVTSRGKPRIAGNYQKLGKRRARFFPTAFREHNPADTFILGVQPPELCENKFLLFKSPVYSNLL